MVYDEGKVYLRDVRNGNIHPYERFLAADKNFTPCIPNPVGSAIVEQEQPTESVLSDGKWESLAEPVGSVLS